MMTRTIQTGIAVAALLIVPIAAQSADMPSRYRAPAYSGPTYANWSGGYLGLNLGYGWAKSNWDVPAVDTSPKGGLFGITLGYNVQSGAWLWGFEGDISGSTLKGTNNCAAGVTCETKNTWLATARGRVGFAGMNNFLPYLTGGLAFGDIKATASGLASASTTRTGYTIGGGAEYAMLANWSVKLEYLYVDLGKFDCGVSCGAIPDNISFKANVVRGGLNYRF